MRPVSWLLILVLLSLAGCAIMGDAPLGGDKDITPPKPVSQEPANKSTNFSGSKITLNFDENVDLNNAQSEIIFTPQVQGNPVYTAKGKSIVINLKDVKLAPNTTYTILTGNAIRDVHEGNTLTGYSYVFSTGSYLDSLVLKGKVVDALSGSTVPGVLALLYKPGNDSAIYNARPMYYGKVDSAGKFRIANLPKTDFKLYVLGDKNANLTLDEGELAGVFAGVIHLDSNATLKDPVRVSAEPKRSVFIKRLAAYRDEISIRLSGPVDSVKLSGIVNPYVKYSPAMDSVVFWPVQPVSGPVTAAVFVNGRRIDSTFTVQNKSFIPAKVALSYSAPDQVMNKYGTPFIVEAAAPVVSIDSTKAFIQIRGKRYPFKSIRTLTPDKTIIGFYYDYQEDSSYTVKLFPHALTMVSGANDSFSADIKMPDSRNYAYLQFKVDLPDTGRSWVLQLINEKGDIVISKQLTSSATITWPYLAGGNYRVRIIEDINSNGRFDGANLLTGKLPERVIYYPQPIVLKPNWEMADIVFHVEK